MMPQNIFQCACERALYIHKKAIKESKQNKVFAHNQK